jgi:phosphoglucosamine mutase
MGKYFGTDGFRGEANVDVTVEHAFKVGRYLGWYFGAKQGKRASVVIGKDTRRSSYMFEDALSAGLTSSGADVYLLHVTPTPSVSYIVRSDQHDCGIMISASHNVYYDNGIKLINSYGRKMESEVEEEIEAYIDGKIPELPLALREKLGRTIDYSSGRNRYIGYLISLATRSFKNIKVGLDCANGSASQIARSVFNALGATTFIINSEPNGININDNAGSTHIEVLQKFVKKHRLDVGFAYDGDADRCIAIDENGEIVDGDKILYVCGKYLKKQGHLRENTIVTTVMSNLGLFKALDEEGINYVTTPVGDRYVSEEMVNNGYQLGGEQSGHIIYSKYAKSGDGVLTSLMLMEVILEEKESLGKLCEGLKIYPQLLKNARVKDKTEAKENKVVQKAVEQVTKALGDGGRILVRESGTEPVLRVMVEAKSQHLCRKYVNKVLDVIKAEGLLEG